MVYKILLLALIILVILNITTSYVLRDLERQRRELDEFNEQCRQRAESAKKLNDGYDRCVAERDEWHGKDR